MRSAFETRRRRVYGAIAAASAVWALARGHAALAAAGVAVPWRTVASPPMPVLAAYDAAFAVIFGAVAWIAWRERSADAVRRARRPVPPPPSTRRRIVQATAGVAIAALVGVAGTYAAPYRRALAESATAARGPADAPFDGRDFVIRLATVLGTLAAGRVLVAVSREIAGGDDPDDDDPATAGRRTLGDGGTIARIRPRTPRATTPRGR